MTPLTSAGERGVERARILAAAAGTDARAQPVAVDVEQSPRGVGQEAGALASGFVAELRQARENRSPGLGDQVFGLDADSGALAHPLPGLQQEQGTEAFDDPVGAADVTESGGAKLDGGLGRAACHERDDKLPGKGTVMAESKEPTNADGEMIAAAFLARYLADQQKGETQDLATYQALFPGAEAQIEAEYRELLGEDEVEADDADRIGPYRILSELGRGGQSVVYLAEDPRLGRRCALKVLPAAALASRAAKERFEREAQLLGRLDHPGICVIHEAGEHEGLPYIAMRAVEGESLAQRIAQSRRESAANDSPSFLHISFDDEPDEVSEPVSSESRQLPKDRIEMMRLLQLIEGCARALHAAHEAGLLHRDIKPGNIMVTPEGQPVLLDFGLARDTKQSGATLTQSGDLMGTPAYMSPEQLLAQRVSVDRRSDVYSLGVTLFECLTLQRPFEGETRDALYRAIIAAERPDSRKLNPLIDRELDIVLATALERDRERRYPSALDFAEDLRRIRCYEPILARPAGPHLRLRRWAQRNPGLAASVGAALVTMFVVLGVVLHFLSESRDKERTLSRAVFDTKAAKTRAEGLSASLSLELDEKQERIQEKEAALLDREAALRRARANYLAARSLLQRDEDPELALGLALAGADKEEGALIREATLASLERLPASRILPTDGREVRVVELTPWGEPLAVCENGRLLFWNADLRGVRHIRKFSGAILGMTFSAEARRIALRFADKVIVLDSSGLEIGRISSADANDLAFVDGGRRLLVAKGKLGGEGTLLRCSWEDGEEEVLWRSPGAACTDIAPFGNAVAVSCARAELVVLELSTGALRWRAAVEKGGPWPRCAVAGGRCYMSTAQGVVAYDAISGAVVEHEAKEEISRYPSLVAKAGNILIHGVLRQNYQGRMTQPGQATVIDGATGKRLGFGHRNASAAYAFSEEGRFWAGSLAKGRIEIRMIDEPMRVRHLSGALAKTTSLAFGPAGSVLYSVHDGGTVRAWELKGAGVLPRYEHACHDLALGRAADGSLAVLRKQDEPGIAWIDPQTLIQRRFTAISTPDDSVFSSMQTQDLAVSRDGRFALAAPQPERIQLVDIASGEALREFEIEMGSLQQLAFGLGGKRLLFGLENRTLQIYDAETGALTGVINELGRGPLLVSPDGKRVLVQRSRGNRHRACLINVESAEVKLEFALSQRLGLVLALSHDGERVAIAADHDLAIYDVAGELIEERRSVEPLTALAFSPDGQSILLGDRAGFLREQRIGAEASSRFRGHRAAIERLTWSAAGAFFASAAADARARVWERNGDLRFALKAHRPNGSLFDPTFERLEFIGEHSILSIDQNAALRVWPLDPVGFARAQKERYGYRDLEKVEREEFGVED